MKECSFFVKKVKNLTQEIICFELGPKIHTYCVKKNQQESLVNVEFKTFAYFLTCNVY